jgi:uncharacterized protein YjbI with pentapeptide repeats
MPAMRAVASTLPLASWFDFTGAHLAEARLNGAALRHAKLMAARLWRATLGGADLRHATCERARFAHVDLRDVRLDDANFARASLLHCNLEGTEVAGLLATSADFTGSAVTGARWPGARLAGASFRSAGLAGIDWHGADLRGCDFTGATFHLGSSRSGLVGSPIASEGSRTGYYTDEALEQTFQAPEDIRKANLRDCDLRGAHVSGTDFYLVDARGARLDPWQRAWLRRCRAILDPEPS